MEFDSGKHETSPRVPQMLSYSESVYGWNEAEKHRQATRQAGSHQVEGGWDVRLEEIDMMRHRNVVNTGEFQ